MLGMAMQPRGLTALIQRLERSQDKMAVATSQALAVQLSDLVIYIRSEKLSGQILNLRTGDLADKIGSEITSVTFPIRASVFSRGVKYAAIHEYGGVINHPGSSKFQAFMASGSMVYTHFTAPHQIVMPERSYIRSSVSENLVGIKSAVKAAIKEALQS